MIPFRLLSTLSRQSITNTPKRQPPIFTRTPQSPSSRTTTPQIPRTTTTTTISRMTSSQSNTTNTKKIETNPIITTLIFDVDDTLYDISTGFTHHRLNYGATSFMTKYLNVPTTTLATSLREEYFKKYHSTAKALRVAETDGKFLPYGAPPFDPEELSSHWETELDYSLLGGPDPAVVGALRELSPDDVTLVVFSNGPRGYCLKVLRTLDLLGTEKGQFAEDSVFAVTDVLPYCKPEEEAFRSVLERVGARPEECVMVEDSMKNVRAAKALGMKTVLVTGKKGRSSEVVEETRVGDDPDGTDESVDVSVEVVAEMREAIAGLWKSPAVFEGSGVKKR